MENGYDQGEMEMRNLAFEVVTVVARAKAFLVKMEWEKLKKENAMFEKDYPTITELILGNLNFLNPNSPGSKMIFDNPLMKLAILSQPPMKDDDGVREEEKYG